MPCRYPEATSVDAPPSRPPDGGSSAAVTHERHRRRSRRAPRRAAHRPGHGGAGPAAGPRPPRCAPRHRARLPPLRHRCALRDRGAHRGGGRRGRACGGRRLARRGLHHIQGLARRRAPRQGPPRPQEDAQQYPNGVRGSVPGSLARDHVGSEAKIVNESLRRTRPPVEIPESIFSAVKGSSRASFTEHSALG